MLKASMLMAALLAATSANALSFTTSAPSMLDGYNGYTPAPIFTVGDTIGNYTPPGILDGIGAYRFNASTVRVLVNHEIAAGLGYDYTLANGTSLNGSRVSYFDINRATKTISGSGLAFDTIYDRQGNVVTAGTQLTFGAISRLCSSVLVEGNAYGAGRGVVDRIYMTGEESGNGTMFALNTATGALHSVPGMGYGSWENAAQLDTGTTNKVAFLLSDDTNGSAMLMYVGTKDSDPNAGFLARNGLVGGKLYAWKAATPGVDSPAELNGNGSSASGSWVELTTFDASKAGQAGYDAQGYALAATLQTQADSLGAFSFSRPEDIAPNKVDPNLVAFASTGSATDSNSDVWGTVYTFKVGFDANGDPAATTVAVIADGNDDATFSLRSPDNLDWADADTIIVNEDRSANWASVAGANPNEASILELELDGTITRVATINRIVPPGQTDSLPADFGNWETSGILDVSRLFGHTVDGAVFLTDVQAHSISLGRTNLVEGGQLLFLETGVPEPATWAMMIGGFGLVGSAMRRRRTGVVAA